MVKKLFALASVTALGGLVAAIGVTGCTSENDPVPSGPENDAGTPDAKTKDAGPKPDNDSGEPETETCYDSTSAGILKDSVLTENFPGGRCTDSERDAILSGCFGQGGSQAACTAAMDAAKDCGACILGGDSSTKTFDLPAFVPYGNNGKGLISIYACFAVALGKPECALDVTNPGFCTSSACESCAEDEADACETQAQDDACKQVQVPADCQAVFEVKQSDAVFSKCVASQTDSMANLKATIHQLCTVGVGGDGGT
jgi:hypothetical protein